MKGNELLVFDPGNQFSQEVVPPYCLLPSYWRRFVFGVLKPRDFAVYMYVVSLCDKHDIAYPSVPEIQDDLQIASPTTVTASLGRLEESGFLRRKRAVLPRRKAGPHQNVYLRPLPEYTLHKLLERKEIDGDLYPTTMKRSPKRGQSNKAVQVALRRMLGDSFETYDAMESTEERTRFLLERLDRIVFAKRAIGKLSYDLIQGRLAKRNATKLKNAEDALLVELNAIFQKHLPAHYQSDPFRHTLTSRVKASGDALQRLVERSDANGIITWLEGFAIDSRRLESDVLQYVGERAYDSPAASAEVVSAFVKYRTAIQTLQERAEEAQIGPLIELPF